MKTESTIERMIKIALAGVIIFIMFIPLCLYAGVSISIMLLKQYGRKTR